MNLVRFGNNYFIIEMHSAFVFIIFETIFAFKIIDNMKSSFDAGQRCILVQVYVF